MPAPASRTSRCSQLAQCAHWCLPLATEHRVRSQALGATNKTFRTMGKSRGGHSSDPLWQRVAAHGLRSNELLKAATRNLSQRISWVVSKLEDGASPALFRFNGTLILTEAQLAYLCRLHSSDRGQLGEFLGYAFSASAADWQDRISPSAGRVVSLTVAPYASRDLSAAEMLALENLLSGLPCWFRWHHEVDPTFFEATAWVAGLHSSRRPLHWYLESEDVYQGVLEP